MKMGSANVEQVSHNDSNSESVPPINDQPPQRFPCDHCGNEYTKRALPIHRHDCSNTDDCSCFCCSNRKQNKRRKIMDIDADEPFKKKVAEFLIQYSFQSNIQNSNKSVMVPVQVPSLPEETFNTDKKENIIPVACVNASTSSTGSVNGETVATETEPFDDYHDGVQCNRKLFCSICKQHVFWIEFGTHTLEHCQKLASGQVSCPLCNVVHSSPTLFLLHYYSHVSSHPSPCSECHCDHPKCSDACVEPLAEHCYAETADHRCYICLRYFSHFQSLVNHMRLHSKEKPFACPECKRSFRQIGNLQRHMSIHRGDRPHKCPNCSKSFADPATLRNHVRTHTRETPYVCDVCQRGFTQVGNLKRHKALHAQKEPPSSTSLAMTLPVEGPLSVAGPSSASSSTAPIAAVAVANPDPAAGVKLEGDEKEAPSATAPPTVNPPLSNGTETDNTKDQAPSTSSTKSPKKSDLWLPCPKCGKVYTWQYDLDIHYRIHSGVKPYKCEFCNKCFAQSGAVRIHVHRHHPDKKKSV